MPNSKKQLSIAEKMRREKLKTNIPKWRQINHNQIYMVNKEHWRKRLTCKQI